MEQRISETKLFWSCEILFGSDLNVSRQFLDYLQTGGIKSAYRKRAMETHPDRLIGLDLPLRKQGIERFHAVQEAYETLLSFLRTKETSQILHGKNGAAKMRPKPPAPPFRRGHAFSQSATNGTRQDFFYHSGKIRPIILPDETRRSHSYANTENLYRGQLPLRHLLFGHFLYYSGLANWRTIARILTWQKTERPRLGELARRFGMCRQEEIASILNARKPCRPFGETAQMLGILTEHQVRVLLFHQQRMQKKFGTILVEKNLISKPELQELLDRFQDHNVTMQAQ